MSSKTIIGILLIILGVSLFFYYDQYVRPEREAKELLAEGKMMFEKGDASKDKEALNLSINILSKIITKNDYNKTKSVTEALFLIGKCYEKLKLYKLAYIKYSYLVKNYGHNLDDELKKETLMRLAHINILKRYSEEGVAQLYTLLNSTDNKDFRSRVYTELGHTYLRSGRYKKAERMFNISLNEFGSNEEAVLGKARAFKRMGHDNEAYDLYEYFLRYYGDISQYTGDVRYAYKKQAYYSGLNSYRGGRYASAISYFKRILRNFPYDKLAENALYWAGESYFAMKDFNTSISYFNRVMRNSNYSKDQAAQIKKGYAYFLMKKFDIAAREFQFYLRNYPNGRYSNVAKEWKNMSTKELLYRIEDKKLPEMEDEKEVSPDDDTMLKDDEEVSGEFDDKDLAGDENIEFDNVAEL